MDKVNATTLFNLYRTKFKETFPNQSSPSWSIKDSALLKKLINEQGEKASVKYITDAFSFWKVLRKKCNVNGYLTVGVLWGFRFSFLSIINEPKSNGVRYERNETRDRKEKRTKKVNTGKIFLSN